VARGEERVGGTGRRGRRDATRLSGFVSNELDHVRSRTSQLEPVSQSGRWISGREEREERERAEGRERIVSAADDGDCYDDVPVS